MKIKIKNKDKIILIILLALLVLTKLGVELKQDSINIVMNSEKSEINLETEEKINIYKVHIDGEILNPGLYEIEENKRLDDLIKLAGGLTDKADTDRINLAQVLNDGLKIYIPSKLEKENDLKTYDRLTLVDFNKMNKEELETIDGIGEVIANRILSYKKANGPFQKIEDLLEVDGIGEKKLEKIRSKIY